MNKSSTKAVQTIIQLGGLGSSIALALFTSGSSTTYNLVAGMVATNTASTLLDKLGLKGYDYLEKKWSESKGEFLNHDIQKVLSQAMYESIKKIKEDYRKQKNLSKKSMDSVFHKAIDAVKNWQDWGDKDYPTYCLAVKLLDMEAIDLGDDFYQKIGIDLERFTKPELKTLIKNKFPEYCAFMFKELLVRDEVAYNKLNLFYQEFANHELQRLRKVANEELKVANEELKEVRRLLEKFYDPTEGKLSEAFTTTILKHFDKRLKDERLEKKGRNGLKLKLHERRTESPKYQIEFASLYTNFVGRERELRSLQQFLSADDHFLWLNLEGAAGAGKSRLANELGIYANTIGWAAGFASKTSFEDVTWTNFSIQHDTLIILDYVKNNEKLAERLLDKLMLLDNGNNLHCKVRVLLLEREFDEDLKNKLFTISTEPYYFKLRQDDSQAAVTIDKLDDEGRWAIVKQIVAGSEHEQRLEQKKDSILMQLTKQDELQRPLFTLFSAIALREGENIVDWTINDSLEYHLERQKNKYWSNCVLWKDKGVVSDYRNDLENLIWMASIAEKIPMNDLKKAIAEDKDTILGFNRKHGTLSPSHEDHIRKIFSTIGSYENQRDNAIYGLKPDYLAEYFIVTHAQHMVENGYAGTDTLDQVLGVFLHSFAGAFVKMLFVTAQNFLDHPGFKEISNSLHRIPIPSSLKKEYGVLNFGFGVVAHDQGKENEAENYYKQAIAQGDVKAMYNLALLYEKQGKDKEAEDYYNQAIAQGQVEAMFGLAVLYEEQGKEKKASYYFKLYRDHKNQT
jgi:hypothetical protein